MISQDFTEAPNGAEMTTPMTLSQGRPGLLRQLGNGLGGLIVLGLSGLILVIVVLLKSR